MKGADQKLPGIPGRREGMEKAGVKRWVHRAFLLSSWEAAEHHKKNKK